MGQYHMRRSEKKIDDPKILLEIIRDQKYMTLAMCDKGEPYLVTVNYAFDNNDRCFFFHCARRGKKIDYLTNNPVVWGQVLDDRGYREGECDYAYRTLHFKGKVEFVTTISEKKRALRLLINQLEPDPESVTQRLLNKASLQKVTVGKVNVQFMSGKINSI
ncbi:MAG: hypothetical protein GWO20_15045 [Candidatus Korarchaeota archaeon]|nr:hypothetical protein [Candidatus Korarchaeota archaeon]NIU83734.1 hypothetical protein [Candidatus Thorarchaeota archaeon]NIW15687.1 hypothetical protein [Candidatus Thorarchaeota archaeon]